MKAAAGAAGRAATPRDTGRTTAVSAGQTMRAIVQAGYGSADVLHLAEIGRPAAAGGEVLLRVHAAVLDRGTWHLMAGQPYVIRLVSGLRAPKNRYPDWTWPARSWRSAPMSPGSRSARRCSASAGVRSPSTRGASQDKLARKPAQHQVQHSPRRRAPVSSTPSTPQGGFWSRSIPGSPNPAGPGQTHPLP